MKASEAKLLDFLRKSTQFVIPIYQRAYSWTERECRQLWDDIIRTGGNDDVTSHFIGSIVYVERGLYQVTGPSPLLVIDGQQRLTTISLLIAALAKTLETRDEGDREPIDGFSPRKLRNYYLVNAEEEGERHHKLALSQTDKNTLLAIVGRNELPAYPSVRLMENYALFEAWIAGCNGDISALCKGLAKLVVVDISLDRSQDNPQLIFESMNSTGRELTQADLIRNFILMGLEPKQQTRLYEDHWRPMEVEFGQEAYGVHFDAFMRHYLTLKTGAIPRIGEVYEAFKTYSRNPEVAAAGVDWLVADVHTFARHYCAMALAKETNAELAEAFGDLRELKVDTVYPFLLELYHDYACGVLSREDLVAAVRLVESYIFRRAVCTIPTNSLNKTFTTISKALKKDRYLESIQAYLLLLRSYRRFPGDEEFVREFKVRDLYKFLIRSYVFRRLENCGRKEAVQVNEFTIEHIMPQNENLSPAWKADLGPEWSRIHETWLHTLGNLTLTGYNSEYSDRPFCEKRDMDGGFRQSPLRMNEGLGQIERWNEEEIEARAARLATAAVAIWKVPTLPPDVLSAYDSRSVSATPTYTLADHPNLSASPPRELYEAFRGQVLVLDPCVTEEILKIYIAYKAETNFVDIVPQSRRLRLSINMRFHEIHDPRGLCRDVTGLHHWGNGDIEIYYDSLDDLPYIMGLVRQSFEKQMGNGGAE